MNDKINAKPQEIVKRMKVSIEESAISGGTIIMTTESAIEIVEALSTLPTTEDTEDIPTIAYLKGVEDGKSLKTTTDEREVLMKFITSLDENEYYTFGGLKYLIDLYLAQRGEARLIEKHRNKCNKGIDDL